MGVILSILALLVAITVAALVVVVYRKSNAVATHPGGVRQGGQGVEVVADLDALVSKTIGFQFQGKTHRIPPLSVEEFMRAMNAIAEIDRMKSEETAVVELGQLITAYTNIFAIVCPTITRDHVERMTQQQVAALFQLVLEAIMGRAQAETQKKSTTPSTTRTSGGGSKAGEVPSSA